MKENENIRARNRIKGNYKKIEQKIIQKDRKWKNVKMNQENELILLI